MTDSNKMIMFRNFIKAHCNYCPLLFIFSTKAANHEIKRLHERRMRALLNYERFIDMLSKGSHATVHLKNIQKLVIEFFKYLYGLLVFIINKAFTKRVLTYSLRSIS